MRSLVERLDRRWYPGFERNWDDTLFRQRILGQLNDTSDLLDVGAGAGIVPQMDFSQHARSTSGVDPDPRVLENPYLNHAKVSFAENLPFPDNSFDIVISDNVLEHLANPVDVFNEIARVLRPGGQFLFKTPNVIHYMPTIARLTPHRFHTFINRIRGRKVVDTFPTLYRANSSGRLKKLAAETGFHVQKIEHVEGRPEYLRLSAPTYLIGYLYEKIVNCSRIFERMRILIIGEFILKD